MAQLVVTQVSVATLTIQFSGDAAGGKAPYTYIWAFGDGGSSVVQNPAHTYKAAGTYPVTLTAKDSTGKRISKSFYIKVSRT